MDTNPLFAFEESVHGGSSSSSSSAASFTAPVDDADGGHRNNLLLHANPPPPPHTNQPSLQTINIKSHVPVVLDMLNPNYQEWHCFFDLVIGKFGLSSHITAAPTAAQQADPDWIMVDQCLVNWIYNTVSRDIMRVIRDPSAPAFNIWAAVVNLFRDHQLHRAVYLEAEYRSLYQGELSITEYTAKLKEIADALRDLGQPVSEPSQILNMLRGLNGKYRHTISTITSKQPPHTFLSARSFLLLEELYDTQHGKMAAQQAMLVQGGLRPPAPSPPNGGSNNSGSGTSHHGGAPPHFGGTSTNAGNSGGYGGNTSGYGGYNANNRNRRRRGRGGGQTGGHSSSPNTSGSGPWPNFPNLP